MDKGDDPATDCILCAPKPVPPMIGGQRGDILPCSFLLGMVLVRPANSHGFSASLKFSRPSM